MARFRGGKYGETWQLEVGERNLVNMGGGDDQVLIGGGTLGPRDRINGGRGDQDQLTLSAEGDFFFGKDQINGFEVILCSAEAPIGLTIDDTLRTAGQLLQIRTSREVEALVFDGSMELDAPMFIEGSYGGDTLIGGQSNDRFLFMDDDTNDLATGNDGADNFMFFTRDFYSWGRDTITDFQPGEDIVTVNNPWVSSFADLLILDGEGGALVRVRGIASEGSIKLLGVSAADLDAGDFLFDLDLPAGVNAYLVTVDHAAPDTMFMF